MYPSTVICLPRPHCTHGLHSLPIAAPGLSPLGSGQGCEDSLLPKLQQRIKPRSLGRLLRGVQLYTPIQNFKRVTWPTCQGSQKKSADVVVCLRICPSLVHSTTSQPLGRTERASGCAPTFLLPFLLSFRTSSCVCAPCICS